MAKIRIPHDGKPVKPGEPWVAPDGRNLCGAETHRWIDPKTREEHPSKKIAGNRKAEPFGYVWTSVRCENHSGPRGRCRFHGGSEGTGLNRGKINRILGPRLKKFAEGLPNIDELMRFHADLELNEILIREALSEYSELTERLSIDLQRARDLCSQAIANEDVSALYQLSAHLEGAESPEKAFERLRKLTDDRRKLLLADAQNRRLESKTLNERQVAERDNVMVAGIVGAVENDALGLTDIQRAIFYKLLRAALAGYMQPQTFR